MFVSHGNTVLASSILLECLLECLSHWVSALQAVLFNFSLNDGPRLHIFQGIKEVGIGLSDLPNIFGHLNQKHSLLCKVVLRFLKESGKSIKYYKLPEGSFVQIVLIEPHGSENAMKLKKKKKILSLLHKQRSDLVQFTHIFLR